MLFEEAHGLIQFQTQKSADLAAGEITAAEKAIRKYTLRDVAVVELGADIGVDITRVITARVAG